MDGSQILMDLYHDQTLHPYKVLPELILNFLSHSAYRQNKHYKNHNLLR